MPPDLDIVIVNWNSGPLLRACLQSVDTAAQAAQLHVSLYVVDNASQDDSAHDLRTECPLTLIRNDRNAGFARACNQGAAAGSAEYVLFLNPDTEVTADSLRQPWQFLAAPENVAYAVCGLQLRDEAGHITRTCGRFPNAVRLFLISAGIAQRLPALGWDIPMSDWDHASSRDVDHVIGAFYLIRRSVFVRLRGFDERYFVYLEDLDLSLRVHRAGFRIRFLAEASARHIGGGTSRQIKARRLFYAVDSRLKYIRQHFPAPLYGLLWLFILGIEPVLRIVAASATLQGGVAKDVLSAYRLLWTKRAELVPTAPPVYRNAQHIASTS